MRGYDDWKADPGYWQRNSAGEEYETDDDEPDDEDE